VVAGGKPDVVRSVPGVPASLVESFVGALTRAAQCFGTLPGTLESVRVHDEAFGKLIDADKVRDAYHDRLPVTAENLTEAGSVASHLLAQFTAAEAAAELPVEPLVEPVAAGDAPSAVEG
jgi:hypothetical protein